MMAVELTGMTWSHSRGYSSIAAVSQRYEELHPEVTLRWEKRSLADFENQPVGELAKRYDLLIIDHPWTGFGLESGVLRPLETLFPKEFLADQEAHSTGPSYRSYTLDGHQLALPVDSAAPIAVYRPDLLSQDALPQTWEEMIEQAKKGTTILAAAPLYTLLDFFMMCATIAGGEETLYWEEVAPPEVAREALERQRELTSLCPPFIFDINPIQVYEMMCGEGENYMYCPFIFGYSNYSRPGYGRHIVKAANVVRYGAGLLRTTLGGTGLAISSKCRNLAETVDFCQYALSEEIQKTIFFDAGGQPGHCAAWLDQAVNARSNRFFLDTLETISHASMRPRYNGYMHMQDNGGAVIREYLMTGRDLGGTLEKLNKIYHVSRRLPL